MSGFDSSSASIANGLAIKSGNAGFAGAAAPLPDEKRATTSAPRCFARMPVSSEPAYPVAPTIATRFVSVVVCTVSNLTPPLCANAARRNARDLLRVLHESCGRRGVAEGHENRVIAADSAEGVFR